MAMRVEADLSFVPWTKMMAPLNRVIMEAQAKAGEGLTKLGKDHKMQIREDASIGMNRKPMRYKGDTDFLTDLTSYVGQAS